MAKRWHIRAHDPAQIAALQRAAGVPDVVAQLLICRGITDPAKARSFLDPKLTDLYDPQTLPGCAAAAQRIHSAIAARHFKVPSFVCVNKWDICPEMAEQIEQQAAAAGAIVLGRIRYKRAITEAQKQAKAVIETRALCSGDIKDIWNNLQHHIGKETST